MDRSNDAEHQEGGTVPRTRGDGPDMGQRLKDNPDLFPAHAGMDRIAQFSSDWMECCSPHTRGWTGPYAPLA